MIDKSEKQSYRLYDLLFIIERMTPEEYVNGYKNLFINYNFYDSPFGLLIIASTSQGVCYMAFEDDETNAMTNLKSRFPNAGFQQKSDLNQQNALLVFQKDSKNAPEIKLHLKGTDFQLKVWECLLQIPMGELSTYGNIAKQIGNPDASRAVGTAIGSNPIAFIIPCHRVIQSSGKIGGYRWGSPRKAAIIDWENQIKNRATQHETHMIDKNHKHK